MYKLFKSIFLRCVMLCFAAPSPTDATSTLSANRGLFLMGTNDADFQAKGYNADLNAALTNLDLSFGVQVMTASGAINIKEGLVVLNGTGIIAATLALPTAGLPSAGGDDGRELTVKSVSAFAHTVTTPASGINGSKHIATCGGAVTDSQDFAAWNGSWWTRAGSGITLS